MNRQIPGITIVTRKGVYINAANYIRKHVIEGGYIAISLEDQIQWFEEKFKTKRLKNKSRLRMFIRSELSAHGYVELDYKNINFSMLGIPKADIMYLAKYPFADVSKSVEAIITKDKRLKLERKKGLAEDMQSALADVLKGVDFVKTSAIEKFLSAKFNVAPEKVRPSIRFALNVLGYEKFSNEFSLVDGRHMIDGKISVVYRAASCDDDLLPTYLDTQKFR